MARCRAFPMKCEGPRNFQRLECFLSEQYAEAAGVEKGKGRSKSYREARTSSSIRANEATHGKVCGTSMHDERTYLGCLFRSQCTGVRAQTHVHPPAPYIHTHTRACGARVSLACTPLLVGEVEPLGHGRATRTPILETQLHDPIFSIFR